MDYRFHNTTFSDIAAYRLGYVGFSAGGFAEKNWEYEVSGNYFDMLGIKPLLGRFFHDSDEHGPNSAPYIVLSESFWNSRFSRDSRVIGTTVSLNKHPFTIIGVAPRGFHGTELFMWPDFWMPMVNEQQVEGFDFLGGRGSDLMWVLGRLKPGVTVQQAADNLNTISSQLGKQYPAFDDGLNARLVKPGLMGDILGDPTRRFLFGIMLLALLVLLAACVNLASIFAARVADRGRELAIRMAIGSSRWHILRQLLTEAILVSLLGGTLGTFFVVGFLEVLSRWQPFTELPVHLAIISDLRVYGIALLLSISSGILFGLLPLRQIWQMDATYVIKGGAKNIAVLRPFTLRDILLGFQVVLCTLLVTASLVALRGMERSLRSPLGFQPQSVMLADTDMHMAGYSDNHALIVQQRMLEEINQIPGVTAVGTIDELPLAAGVNHSPVYRQGTTEFQHSKSVLNANTFSISPGYLQAAGTRLLMGRDLTWHDNTGAPKVALVNETFAHRMFGKSPAIGNCFMIGKDNLYQIVGIVENGKYESLTEDPRSAIFFPLAQHIESDTSLVVRSQVPPVEIAAALNHTLASIDPNLPFSIHSWPTVLSLVLFPAASSHN